GPYPPSNRPCGTGYPRAQSAISAQFGPWCPLRGLLRFVRFLRGGPVTADRLLPYAGLGNSRTVRTVRTVCTSARLNPTFWAVARPEQGTHAPSALSVTLWFGRPVTEGMLKPGMVFELADGTLGERPPTLTKPENRSAGEKVG